VMQQIVIPIISIAAYLLGSIPTALIISRRTRGLDIRKMGDGNMGARNTFHQLGPGFGVTVAAIDFTKGLLPVFLAYVFNLDTGWQITTAAAAILGHDFPLFAGFKGGQGTATSLGTMLMLFPVPTIIGLSIYGLVYLIIRNSDVSLAIGGATIAAFLGFTQQWTLFAYSVSVFLFIPLKMYIDSPRRRAIKEAK
jgi:acyl phosphate:glycerol-3-phosphate acyltransferase